MILSQEYPLHEADLQVGRISILSDEVRMPGIRFLIMVTTVAQGCPIWATLQLLRAISGEKCSATRKEVFRTDLVGRASLPTATYSPEIFALPMWLAGWSKKSSPDIDQMTGDDF